MFSLILQQNIKIKPFCESKYLDKFKTSLFSFHWRDRFAF